MALLENYNKAYGYAYEVNDNKPQRYLPHLSLNKIIESSFQSKEQDITSELEFLKISFGLCP